LEEEWAKRKHALWFHSGDKLQMGLHVAGYKVFDPGGKDEGTNRFIYTCKCGWIDLGHFFISAGVSCAVRVNLAQGPFSGALAEDIAYKVGKLTEKLQEIGRFYTGIDPKTQADKNKKAWAEGLNSIFGVYDLKGGEWIPGDTRRQDGWSQSAYTVEDLPSDRMGAHLGAITSIWALGRINPLKPSSQWGPRLKDDIKKILKKFLDDCGAVNLDDVSIKVWGGRRLSAGAVLRGDAERVSESIRVQVNAKAGYNEFVEGMTMDPKYLYNRTDKPKKTYSHDCVCDGDKPRRGR